MERNQKRNKKRKKNNPNSRKNWTNLAKNKKKGYKLSEKDKADDEAIKVLKRNKPTCSMCEEPIIEISSCLADRKTGAPVHFDCVLKKITQEEKLLPNQKIVYIGKGSFAVVLFENPRDLKHFTIIRKIEWEQRDSDVEWRSEIANLYSQVH
ncbi:MAG TPA: hypothetical protein VFC68_04925 [Treponemataceae bacterium]|nr:hypothetical protein [Treponemataceae bacterium]